MPYSEGRDIVPVISNYKWSASLSHVVVTKKTAAGVQVLKDDQQLEARILKAVSAKLTPSQQKKFEKGSTSISMHASQDGRNTEITWIAEVPKSLEDPIITVKANVEFKLDDKDNILVKLIKVSYKED